MLGEVFCLARRGLFSSMLTVYQRKIHHPGNSSGIRQIFLVEYETEKEIRHRHKHKNSLHCYALYDILKIV